MNSIKMNGIQMINVLDKCQGISEEKNILLTFEDSITFLNGAIGLDYHSDNMEIFINQFIKERDNRTISKVEIVRKDKGYKKKMRIKEQKELMEIIIRLKPMESAWCKSLEAEIIMFHSGYSINFYNSQLDVWTYGYFVPNCGNKK